MVKLYVDSKKRLELLRADTKKFSNVTTKGRKPNSKKPEPETDQDGGTQPPTQPKRTDAIRQPAPSEQQDTSEPKPQNNQPSAEIVPFTGQKEKSESSDGQNKVVGKENSDPTPNPQNVLRRLRCGKGTEKDKEFYERMETKGKPIEKQLRIRGNFKIEYNEKTGGYKLVNEDQDLIEQLKDKNKTKKIKQKNKPKKNIL